ncbi:hypothetical protein [Pedobacter nanyangensis]|nr:hypothetical protein [Pedobacter nanyangensis]
MKRQLQGEFTSFGLQRKEALSGDSRTTSGFQEKVLVNPAAQHLANWL